MRSTVRPSHGRIVGFSYLHLHEPMETLVGSYGSFHSRPEDVNTRLRNILEGTCHEAPGIGRDHIWGKVHGFHTDRHSELVNLESGARTSM